MLNGTRKSHMGKSHRDIDTSGTVTASQHRCGGRRNATVLSLLGSVIVHGGAQRSKIASNSSAQHVKSD